MFDFLFLPCKTLYPPSFICLIGSMANQTNTPVNLTRATGKKPNKTRNEQNKDDHFHCIFEKMLCLLEVHRHTRHKKIITPLSAEIHQHQGPQRWIFKDDLPRDKSVRGGKTAVRFYYLTF